MKVYWTSDEEYPFYVVTREEDDHYLLEAEVPDDILERYETAVAEYSAAKAALANVIDPERWS